MVSYTRLFSPLTMGSCTIKNRIVSSGHDTVMVNHGEVSEQLIAYHRARAEGGVGLIIVQVAGVHESARYTSHILMAIDDSCIEGYAKLASVVHQSGTKIFGQLFHPGREVMESQDGSSPVALAPSAVPNERFRVMPRALQISEIDEIIDGYAHAALRLQRAGLDGVEIVASHGYLPAQFLNPFLNLREDEYARQRIACASYSVCLRPSATWCPTTLLWGCESHLTSTTQRGSTRILLLKRHPNSTTKGSLTTSA